MEHLQPLIVASLNTLMLEYFDSTMGKNDYSEIVNAINTSNLGFVAQM